MVDVLIVSNVFIGNFVFDLGFDKECVLRAELQEILFIYHISDIIIIIIFIILIFPTYFLEKFLHFRRGLRSLSQ